jgi:hypothetical protein
VTIGRGAAIERVLSDNGSQARRDACLEFEHRTKGTRPYRPQTNCEGVGVLLRAA